MLWRIEILLHRHADDQKPEIFLLSDEADHDAPLAHLPADGDFIVIDRLHMGKVTSRTFFYDLDNEGSCHVMINADRVTRTPRPVNSP